jgi:predicted nucleotidyltransferase
MNKTLPENIAKEINLFISVVMCKIEVKKVILFGSWMKDLGNHWSDIDIAIISDHFDNMEQQDRVLFLLKIANSSGCRKIDPQGFTSLEISERNGIFINEVACGLEIFCQQN